MSKRIILLSTFFPPERHIATSRIEAYAKYLSIFHEVIVITLGEKDSVVEYRFDNNTTCKVYYIQNGGLFTSLLFYSRKESWITHKLKTVLRTIYNKFGISYYSNWAIKAKKILSNILYENNIDILISSCAPDDTLEISYQVLYEQKNQSVKWILDMRDEYSEEVGLSIWVKKKRVNRELKYSQRANLVIAASKPALDMYEEKIPNVDNYLEIRNGFDHDFLFQDGIKSNFLKIGYFGSFYGDIKPDSFFDAILQLNIAEKFKIYIATKNLNFSIPDVLKDNVVLLPYMSYKESISKMSSMDVNLLILPKNRKGLFSGKVFDYLSSGRPIFAIVNPYDVAADLICENNAGYIADFGNLENIKFMISKLYNDWNNETLIKPNMLEIAKQHRKYQVQKLNRWITKL